MVVSPAFALVLRSLLGQAGSPSLHQLQAELCHLHKSTRMVIVDISAGLSA